MPSTLTDAQIVNLFQLFGLPWVARGGSGRYMEGDGLATANLLAGRGALGVYATAVAEMFYPWLDEIAGTAAETELKSLCDQYAELKPQLGLMEMQSGNVGDVQGMKWSPNDREETLRRLARTAFPYFDHLAGAKAREARGRQEGIGSIPVAR